jgi:hypothetical protein
MSGYDSLTVVYGSLFYNNILGFPLYSFKDRLKLILE